MRLFSALLALIIVALVLFHRRKTAPRLPPAYAKALRMLSRHGFERTPTMTARDFVGSLEPDLPASCAVAFRSLTEAYLKDRFGAEAPSPANEDLERLRVGLRSLPRRSRGSASPRRAA